MRTFGSTITVPPEIYFSKVLGRHAVHGFSEVLEDLGDKLGGQVIAGNSSYDHMENVATYHIKLKAPGEAEANQFVKKFRKAVWSWLKRNWDPEIRFADVPDPGRIIIEYRAD